MVHRACKLAIACVPAEDPVAFTTDVRPNITGTFTSMYVSASGAFAVTSSGQCSLGNGYGSIGADFDASRSSGIYGSSQTVQPASLRVMAIIKS